MSSSFGLMNDLMSQMEDMCENSGVFTEKWNRGNALARAGAALKRSKETDRLTGYDHKSSRRCFARGKKWREEEERSRRSRARLMYDPRWNEQSPPSRQRCGKDGRYLVIFFQPLLSRSASATFFWMKDAFFRYFFSALAGTVLYYTGWEFCLREGTV